MNRYLSMMAFIGTLMMGLIGSNALAKEVTLNQKSIQNFPKLPILFQGIKYLPDDYVGYFEEGLEITLYTVLESDEQGNKYFVAFSVQEELHKYLSSDLQKLVNLAAEEGINVEELAAVIDSFSEAEMETFSELIATKAEIPLQEWRAHSAKHRTKRKNQKQRSLRRGDWWQQFIENAWVWWWPQGHAYPNSYWQDKNCDGDSSDNEYVFRYDVNTSNPNSLRWTTDSPLVYAAFMAAYGGEILGYSHDEGVAYLCIGDKGVWAAGGPWLVKATTFLHNQ